MNIIKKLSMTFRNFLMSPFYKKLKVYDSINTLDLIVQKNLSIGRFGDGELELMTGQDLNFQKSDIVLVNKLKELKTSKNFLVCIPNIFDKAFNKINIIDSEFKFWRNNKLKYYYLWKKYFNRNKCLGDAFISRFYLRYKDKSKVGDYIIKLKKLWDKRNIIIVEGYTSQVGVGNDILDNAKSIRRILCPNKNAFDYYESIYNSVIENYNDGDLIILALGPTATVLAYDLSKKGIQALDMGHFDIEYEWYLAKTDIKIPIKNKHVNECNSMGMSPVDNDEYKKQIISEIK